MGRGRGRKKNPNALTGRKSHASAAPSRDGSVSLHTSSHAPGSRVAYENAPHDSTATPTATNGSQPPHRARRSGPSASQGRISSIAHPTVPTSHTAT